MKITIKRGLEVTEPLEVYIEEKLSPFGKFVKQFEDNGEIDLHIEVGHTSERHNNGDELYEACIDLHLPKRTLRAEAKADDIRKAIDEARNILHMEIEKYKTQHAHPSEREK